MSRIVLTSAQCLCVFCVGPLCGPPLRWWVLCGALPSVWVPCVGPLCGSPVWVPCVGPLCVGSLCGSPVWVVALRCGIYSRDVSRSFTRSRSHNPRINKRINCKGQEDTRGRRGSLPQSLRL